MHLIQPVSPWSAPASGALEQAPLDADTNATPVPEFLPPDTKLKGEIPANKNRQRQKQ